MPPWRHRMAITRFSTCLQSSLLREDPPGAQFAEAGGGLPHPPSRSGGARKATGGSQSATTSASGCSTTRSMTPTSAGRWDQLPSRRTTFRRRSARTGTARSAENRRRVNTVTAVPAPLVTHRKVLHETVDRYLEHRLRHAGLSALAGRAHHGTRNGPMAVDRSPCQPPGPGTEAGSQCQQARAGRPVLVGGSCGQHAVQAGDGGAGSDCGQLRHSRRAGGAVGARSIILRSRLGGRPA